MTEHKVSYSNLNVDNMRNSNTMHEDFLNTSYENIVSNHSNMARQQHEEENFYDLPSPPPVELVHMNNFHQSQRSSHAHGLLIQPTEIKMSPNSMATRVNRNHSLSVSSSNYPNSQGSNNNARPSSNQQTPPTVPPKPVLKRKHQSSLHFFNFLILFRICKTTR
jgi:hypothetical protein